MSSAAATAVTAQSIDTPSEKSLVFAARQAITEDKPILLDYYNDTRDGRAFLGEESSTKEKYLVRSDQEYTSAVQKILRADDHDFVVITENSIYIVSRNIKKRNITLPDE
jgi:hypothetical protein